MCGHRYKIYLQGGRMLYNKTERLEIAKKVYTNELEFNEALDKYELSNRTLRRYIDYYKTENGIKTKTMAPRNPDRIRKENDDFIDIEAYKAMSKEELINELILAKANELRAKKGYEVKGDGANKVFVPLNNKNSK
jgi:transposase